MVEISDSVFFKIINFQGIFVLNMMAKHIYHFTNKLLLAIDRIADVWMAKKRLCRISTWAILAASLLLCLVAFLTYNRVFFLYNLKNMSSGIQLSDHCRFQFSTWNCSAKINLCGKSWHKANLYLGPSASWRSNAKTSLRYCFHRDVFLVAY